jgi:hypothetical protein
VFGHHAGQGLRITGPQLGQRGTRFLFHLHLRAMPGENVHKKIVFGPTTWALV